MCSNLNRIIGLVVHIGEGFPERRAIAVVHCEVDVLADTHWLRNDVAWELCRNLDANGLGRQEITLVDQELSLLREQQELLVERDGMLEESHLGVAGVDIDGVTVQQLGHSGPHEVEILSRLTEDNGFICKKA